MDTGSIVRSDVFFEGQVQGVGFRYTAESAARRYAVTGFVQNLPDGRVKLVAEGDRQEIDRFLADLARRMEGHIHNQVRTNLPATGEFTRFSIRQ